MINFIKSMFTGKSGNISAMRVVQVLGVLTLVVVKAYTDIVAINHNIYQSWQSQDLWIIIGILTAGKVGQAFSLRGMNEKDNTNSDT